ncbi:MAG: glycosyltransferase family 9 protein, partial [Gammaproteobacteria bacterium]
SWNNKAWVDDYWIQLAQMLFKKEPELKIFLTFGSKLEQDRVLYFKKICPQFEIIDSAGQGLAELLPVLARAWGIVSVDSGLGHLGLALNTPVIGIYGPTSPLKTGFWGEKTALCQSSLPCVPCLKKVCKIDPRAKHPPCMQALPPNLVFDHILKLIG